MIPQGQVADLIGSTVHDSAGNRVGQILDLSFDDEGVPHWASVRDGSSVHVVPLAEATVDHTGLTLPFARATVDAAPPAALFRGRLDPAEQDALLTYYAVGSGQDGPRAGAPVAVTRSEERLRAGVETVISARARLQKYIVTETRTIEVEVRREEARLVYDDTVEQDGYDTGTAAAGYSETVDGASPHSPASAERVFVLSQEEPVVTLQAVPYARARLITELETTEVPVTAQVRVEQVTLTTYPAGTLAPAPEREDRAEG